MLVLDRVGEAEPWIGVLLFAPGWVWVVPVLLLALAGWKWKLRWACLPAAVAAWVVFGVLDWRPPRPVLPARSPITLFACNRGGFGDESVFPFIKKLDADLVILQESNEIGPHLRNTHPSLHVAWEDQYVLLSRFPIRGVRPLYLFTGHRREPVAARFEVEGPQGLFAVYAVHLPTPRDGLRAVLFTRQGIQFPRSDGPYGRLWWENRIAVAAELAACLRSERLPWIAAGDFNAPSFGRVYRTMEREGRDAHSEAGAGFGWTFPSHLPFPKSLAQPWLRLDHVFVGPGWGVLQCRVEPFRKAQHRGVVARLAFPCLESGE